LSAKDKQQWKTPRKPIITQIRRKEPVNWLQDNIVLAFDKESHNAKDILRVIQQQPEFSKKISLWNIFEVEGEEVYKISHMKDPILVDNETAFKQFKKDNLQNPQYAEKYVAFVNGSYEGVDESESKLVEKIYEDFGNVEMFVGKISSAEQEEVIDTPELE